MSQKYRKKYSRTRNPNKRLIPLLLGFGGLVLLVAAGLAIWAGSSPQAGKASIEVNGAPSLKVDKEKVDLGDVKLGKTVDVSFELTNVGDQPLSFSEAPYIEVKEGC